MNCDLCGLSAGTRPLERELDGQSRAFCCLGCLKQNLFDCCLCVVGQHVKRAIHTLVFWNCGLGKPLAVYVPEQVILHTNRVVKRGFFKAWLHAHPFILGWRQR